MLEKPIFMKSCHFSGQQKTRSILRVLIGAPRKIRTLSLLIRSQMLYPVELWAHKQILYTPFTPPLQAFFSKKRNKFIITDKTSCKTAISRYILKEVAFTFTEEAA